MNIQQLYLEKITQEILLEMLKDGTIPSSPALAEALRDKKAERTLSAPVSVQPRVAVERFEQASAKKFNDIMTNVISDIDVLYDALLNTEQQVYLGGARTFKELSRLQKEAQRLNDRADRLLLITANTEGLLSIVGDSFDTTERINLEETTALIDTASGSAQLSYYEGTEITGIAELDLSRLRDEDIRVTPLDPALTRNPGTHNSSLVDMVRESDHPWMYTVASRSTVPSASIEVVIDLNRAVPDLQDLTINRISFKPYLTNNSILLAAQYSSDGVSWKAIPVTDPIRRLVGPTLYLFEDVSLRYLKFIITKDSPDSPIAAGSEYRFGIEHVGIYSKKQSFVTSSQLVSAPLFPLAQDGSYKNFSNAALSVACEHILPDTTIDYSIAFLTVADNVTTQTSFYPVVPLNRENRNGQQIISIGDATKTSLSTKMDPSIRDFAFALNSENVLTELTLSSSSPTVWRNVGFNDRYYSVYHADKTLVEAGWRKDGAEYITNGFFEKATSIDFGRSSIEIDGQVVSGRIILSPGIHTFRVSEPNWYSLEGMNRVTSVDSSSHKIVGRRSYYGSLGLEGTFEDAPIIDQNYEKLDPLFPYNHKLLIEGLAYATTYQGERIYKGADMFAAYLPQRLSESDFGLFGAQGDYNIYSIVKREGATADSIMLKWTQNSEDSPREKIVIVEKAGEFAQGLVFKAVFNTSNPRRSPSLDGYTIKVN